MDTIDKNIAADFLLGKLPEKNREHIEEAFIGEQRVFDELLLAENDLIDDYVAGRLSRSDRVMFESVLLPRAKGKVAFARTLAAYAAQEKGASLGRATWIEALRRWPNFARTYSYGFAAAALLLLLTVVGLWMSHPGANELAGDIARPSIVEAPNNAATSVSPETNQQAPLAATANRPVTATANESPRERRADNRKDQKLPGKEPQQPLIATIVLGSITRGEGTAASTELSQKKGLVRLQLPAETGDHRIYSIRVESVDGQQIWQQRRPARRGTINADVQGRRLPPGYYIVTLKGISGDGIAETLNEYSFSIKPPLP